MAKKVEEVEKEVIKHTSTKYRGNYFSVTVSDRDRATLDNKLDDGDYEGVRRWIVKHMRSLDVIPPSGDEGKFFQQDLARFQKVFGAVIE